MRKINAFCTDPLFSTRDVDSVVFCGNGVAPSDNVDVFSIFVSDECDKIYIPDMCDECAFDAFDHIVSTGAKAIVRASYDLDEAGKIEARYKLSPVMLLHKLGVLEHCIVAGGVCLDNDDLDLMAQENVPLIVTPTASAGYGHGVAPVRAALSRGIRVGIGTFDGKYNKDHSLDFELKALRLLVNADMHSEDALSESELLGIKAFEFC